MKKRSIGGLAIDAIYKICKKGCEKVRENTIGRTCSKMADSRKCARRARIEYIGCKNRCPSPK